jgi:hypothetical protein
VTTAGIPAVAASAVKAVPNMANDTIPTAIEVEINHIDYEAFNDLHDGDIVDNSGCSLANALYVCLRIQIAVYARLLAQQKELVERVY